MRHLCRILNSLYSLLEAIHHFKIPAFLVGCLRALDAVDVQTGFHLAYLFLNPVSGAVQLLSGGVPPAFEFFHLSLIHI